MYPKHITFYTVMILLVLLLPIALPLKNRYLYNKGAHLNGKVVLPDVLHYGREAQYSNVSNIICIVSFTMCFVLLSVQKMKLLVVFLFLNILMIYLNILYAIVTILPDSNNGRCQYSETIYDSLKNLGTCNDLNLSGHLLTIIISWYFICKVLGPKYYAIAIVVVIVSFFVVTVSRNHYTVDALNSVMVSPLVLWIGEKMIQYYV
jgi:hypothetical protein